MRRTALKLLALFCLVGPFVGRPAGAQDVSGFVRDATTGAPIPGAVVMVLDATRATVARGLTSTGGAFRLPVSSGITLRVIRIGFAPFEAPLARLAPSPVTISMTLLGRIMDRIAVRANPVCPRRADQREALALWSAATDAFLAMVVANTEASTSGTVTQLLYNRLMEPGGRRIAHQSSRRVVTGNIAPIRADRPPAAFVDSGYVVQRGDVSTYYGPDAMVLLDSSFAATHCLSIRSDARGRPGQIGVAFAPPRDRAVSDIAGVLWLSREPLSLKTLEFEYRGVDQSVIDMRGGGRLEFATLSNGVPTITSWLVRSPRLAYLPAGTMLRGRAVREREVSTIHEIYETGGLIVSGRLADGTTWSAPLATQGGVVLTMRTGTPVVGAVVTFDSTDQRAVTDSAGHFVFHELLPGPHQLRIVDTTAIRVRIADSTTFVLPDSSLQQMVMRVATRRVEIRAATTAPLEVRLPWREVVPGCGVHEGEPRFFVMGVVMTPDSAPVPSADVRLSWTDGSPGGAVETTVATRANTDGAFFVCGIPADRELATRVVTTTGAEMLGTSRLSRSVTNPDGSESRFRTMLLTVSPPDTGVSIGGHASVAGIVLDGRAAADAVARRVQKGGWRVFQVRTAPPEASPGW
ncbi:MAG: carboxypeptidase regulatory-like domain-containing protein [Gemmatimonadaceae bacterium]|nr:carboxypeptidase regulatory-like domain-containing protein [Gemmatimonadaceae bacterium]